MLFCGPFSRSRTFKDADDRLADASVEAPNGNGDDQEGCTNPNQYDANISYQFVLKE